GIDVSKIIFRFRRLDVGHLRILSAGRLVEKKGFEDAIFFLSELYKIMPSARMTIIGEGPEQEKLKLLISRMGLKNNVIVRGVMPHASFIKELYKHTVFFLASKTARDGDREGIPNVLKEAMCSGMPVISTRHSGIPELIHDGLSGVLVDENSPVQAVAAVERLIADESGTREMCLRAHYSVREHFDAEKTAAQTESVYGRILAPKHVRAIAQMLDGRRPLQFRADLHLTSGCNSHCLVCDNWKNPRQSSFSTVQALDMLKDLKEFGANHVRFHGQEPTLRPDLPVLVKAAKDLGLRVGLKTNALWGDGLLETDDLFEHVDDFYLSIDSADSKIHNYLRGDNTSFNRNIDLARKIRQKAPVQTRFYINAVVVRQNYRNLERLVDLAAILKADKLSFVHISSNNKNDIEIFKLREKDWRDLYFRVWPRVLNKSARLGVPVSVHPTFFSLINKSPEEQIALLRSNRGDFDREIKFFSEGHYGREFYDRAVCRGVLDHVTIDWQGRVFACCAMPRSDKTAVGRISAKKRFTRLWNDKKYLDYRNKALNGQCRYRQDCSRNFKQALEIHEFLTSTTDYLRPQPQGPDNHLKYSGKLSDYKREMMVNYAYIQAPFYRNKWLNAGLDIMKGVQFGSLPLSSRQELSLAFSRKEFPFARQARNYDIYRTSSCGSGAFLYARPRILSRYPRMMASFLATGKWKLNAPWIKLTSPNCLETANALFSDAQESRSDPRPNAREEVVIPANENYLEAGSGEIKDLYKIITGSRASLIHANPTYLKLLLYRFHYDGLRFERSFAVHSTYELLLPSTAKIIKKYLACDIFDQYGCSEVGPVSFTCASGGRHVFAGSIYAEVAPDSRYGRQDIGRVLLTDLENTAMPFIRYFNGDIAYIGSGTCCPCGRPHPIMGRIAGREEEIVYSGRKAVLTLEWDRLFCSLENILLYQIEHQQDRIIVRILPENKKKAVAKKSICLGIKEILKNAQIPVEIELVDKILPRRRGKYRTVIVE
ncbi:MAG: glycosyltransferase, partial [Candidatus Omnitrophota bacterium]|nr:glycosyltransferase [Candidatus Omnitrophota bacterium]